MQYQPDVIIIITSNMFYYNIYLIVSMGISLHFPWLLYYLAIIILYIVV